MTVYVGGKKYYPYRVTIDHKLAMSKGGAKRDIDNMVLACYRCNNLKSRLFEDNNQKQRLEKYIVWFVLRALKPIRHWLME